ncbi:MAG: hypothetical protein AAB037_01415 [Chloroflexota bacterium]
MPPERVNPIKLRARATETIERLKNSGIKESEMLSNYGVLMKGRMPTALWRSILSHGNDFVKSFAGRKTSGFSVRLSPSTFESPLAVSLFSPTGRRLFSAKLGFGPGAVIIEAFHGLPVPDWKSQEAEIVAKWVKGKHGGMRRLGVPVNRWLVEFERLASSPAPNYVLREIEKAAAASGYGEVRIRRPETLFWYKLHRKMAGWEGWESPLEHIRAFYYGVAAAERYRKAGEFLVKRL